MTEKFDSSRPFGGREVYHTDPEKIRREAVITTNLMDRLLTHDMADNFTNIIYRNAVDDQPTTIERTVEYLSFGTRGHRSEEVSRTTIDIKSYHYKRPQVFDEYEMAVQRVLYGLDLEAKKPIYMFYKIGLFKDHAVGSIRGFDLSAEHSEGLEREMTAFDYASLMAELETIDEWQSLSETVRKIQEG